MHISDSSTINSFSVFLSTSLSLPQESQKAFPPLKRKYFLKTREILRCECKLCPKACSKAVYAVIIITCHMFGIKSAFIRFTRGRAIPLTKQISRTPADLVYYVLLAFSFFFITECCCILLLLGGVESILRLEEPRRKEHLCHRMLLFI